MPASRLLVICLLLALACAESPEASGASTHAAAQGRTPAPTKPETPDAPALPTVEVAPLEPSGPVVEPSIPVIDPIPAEPAEPGDPLAPIPPSGPEPGSPEADAELAELLDDSTLTQEEFDAAFRGSKPKVDGDQLVFGPGDRTRKRPIVQIGTPSVSASKLAPGEITKLASSHMRAFEGCLAVALSDDSQTAGSTTLIIRFDANGESSSAKLEGGGALGESLRACLVAVADEWRLAAAAGASVRVPLTLTSE